MDRPPLRIVHFPRQAFTVGIEDHVFEGATVWASSIAKTIADCFKYRNKIGIDVALGYCRTRGAIGDVPMTNSGAVRKSAVLPM